MNQNRFVNILYWIAMAGIALYFSYTKGWILADFEFITPQQAQVLIDKDQNVTLLDVRTVDEFKTGHIRGATLIPVSKLEANLAKAKRFKKQTDRSLLPIGKPLCSRITYFKSQWIYTFECATWDDRVAGYGSGDCEVVVLSQNWISGAVRARSPYEKQIK